MRIDYQISKQLRSWKMICSMMQPTYLPWLGYFDFIHRAELFVIYDHTQFAESWQQRNRIRDRNGEVFLLVPIMHTGKPQIIKDVKINSSSNFARKHLMSIHHAYSKAPHYKEYFGEIEAIYKKKHTFLIDLNLDFIRWGMEKFNLKTKVIFSSELGVEGKKVEGVLDAYKKLNVAYGVTELYIPVGSKTYIDENDLLTANDVPVKYQDFKHPVYRQVNYPDFIPQLSFIDFLFNGSREHLIGIFDENAVE